MPGTVENRRAERRTSAVQGTVLVIDDEADIRELLELSLLRMGLAVECTGSVAAAKQLLQSKRYELCLTDMRLPDGDGLELVRFIGVQCADLPVAVITAFGSTENAVAALKAGAFDYLTKPLSLDEVADLPLAMQVKLLRAIQEKTVRKVGATSEDVVDVRIICATHQNLAAGVESGKFRQDLYYRLAVIELRMPPLRECREDIPVLSDAILRRLSGPEGKPPMRLSEEAKKALASYDFPGNTRELENILERAIALAAHEEIQPDDLQLAPPTWVAREPGAPNAKWPLPEYLDRLEKEAILEALEKTRFNRTAAAKLLGITFRALRYRMERLGIR